MFERTASRQPRARASSSAAGTSGNGSQLRQRAPERVLLLGRSAETGERDGHHLAIAPARILPLDLRLELVVRVQQLAATRGPNSRSSSRPMPPFQSISVP